MRVKKCILWILTLGVAGIIFFFSSQSVEASSQLSSGVTDGILGFLRFFNLSSEELVGIHGILRALAHIAVFAALGFFAALLMRCYTHRGFGWLIVTAACWLYAVFDECVQLWFARGRAFELLDIAKDCFGVLLGVGVVVLGCLYIGYRVRHKKGN